MALTATSSQPSPRAPLARGVAQPRGLFDREILAQASLGKLF